ncbi:MAG: hypothetical protein HKM93_15160 [Desulfobacteraceae bacterium]|nr:hypothetical protein [Desulfobacteraceae bacterium]
MTRTWKKIALITGLFLLVVLSAMGILDRGMDIAGLKLLDETNAIYLEDAFDKALAGFLLLSAIKSGLAVVEGSEVGVGFNLELGDVVQPFYDYVDIAWTAALAGGSILTVMQLALKGLDIVDQWALTLLLSAILLFYVCKWWLFRKTEPHRILRQVVQFFFTLSIAVYLLLPLSITATAFLSQKITGPIITETNTRLEALEDFFAPEQLNRSFFAGTDASDLSTFDFRERLNRAGKGIKELIDYLKAATDELAELTIKLIAAYAFDCILFPLFFGLILMTMLKSGIGYVFDLKR